MWTRSKNFKKLTDWAFKTIDADGSGQVDKKELYTGLLMIHLKLATYAGPAACRPATREYCEKIFDQMDVDKSGELDREEFTEVMQIVCAQVFTRVAIQWTMTLMIVPMSKFISGACCVLLQLSHACLTIYVQLFLFPDSLHHSRSGNLEGFSRHERIGMGFLDGNRRTGSDASNDVQCCW